MPHAARFVFVLSFACTATPSEVGTNDALIGSLPEVGAATSSQVRGGVVTHGSLYAATGFLWADNGARNYVHRDCIATKIRADVAITAAHCMTNSQTPTARWWVGFGGRPESADLVPVKEWKVVPGNVDLALLRLENCEGPSVAAELAPLPDFGASSSIGELVLVSYRHEIENNGFRIRLEDFRASPFESSSRLVTDMACPDGQDVIRGGDSGAAIYVKDSNALVAIQNFAGSGCYNDAELGRSQKVFSRWVGPDSDTRPKSANFANIQRMLNAWPVSKSRSCYQPVRLDADNDGDTDALDGYLIEGYLNGRIDCLPGRDGCALCPPGGCAQGEVCLEDDDCISGCCGGGGDLPSCTPAVACG